MEPAASDRPDPDQLLARLKSEEEKSRRGRLKIYLGAAPGVGKTFAMLSAVRRLKAQGVDVVVGLIETHGRAETEILLRGLELLPRLTVDYQSHTLRDFDLDAALARKPAILAVDEMAHTNAPGMRHEKRWQDIHTLLAAGIGVYTTLNVQHIDSLNDIVAQITGVQVRETVPDAMFDEADEVELVDLPPDLLLERLRAGKVYVPQAAQAALESFFRKGNLTALREIALRKTAQWVDAQLQRYKQEQGVRRIWPAGDRMLVCVGPSPLSARLIRAAHRMAVSMHAELFAVHIEASHAGRQLTAADRDRVLQHLRLAASLGARTATLDSADAAAAIIGFARDHNIGRIVLGKTEQPRWRELLFGSFTNDVIRKSGDIDVQVIRAAEEDAVESRAERGAAEELPLRVPWRSYLAALGYTALATAVAFAIYVPPDLSAEAMLLILGVVLAAIRCGRGPAVAAAATSVLAFNFLFTEPRFTFAVAEPAYLVAFAVMLVVGLTLSTLVNKVRDRANAAQERERETEALYSLTRELAGAASSDEVAKTTVAHLRDAFAGSIAFLVPVEADTVGLAGVLASHGDTDWLDLHEVGVARWCWLHGKAAGDGTANLPGSAGLYLPLRSPRGRLGVLGLRRAPQTPPLSAKLRLLLETFVEQAALALERLQLAEDRLQAQREAESERLRSTLLSSVSHDLRTPLTTITGAASTLCDQAVDLGATARRELAQGILQEARRLNDLIANLVFATRLEAGGIELRKEWTSIEDIVGAALRRADLDEHRVETHLEPDLPLLEADPVLLEQALYNLLENAARHTPRGTRVEVRAWVEKPGLLIEVSDEGPGIQPADHARVFRQFVRGPRSPGMGLGLAICEGILKAHGGRAWIEPGGPRGVAFRCLLPLPAAQPNLPADGPAGDGQP